MADITWQHRHIAAMTWPNDTERPLVDLLAIITATATAWGHDYVLREGVAQLILGTRQLLVGHWGDRLEMGLVDGELVKQASRIGYCLDHEKFDDGCLEGQ